MTELLISVLVISLGLTMFATAVMSARRMIELGTQRVDTYYTGRNTLEQEENSSNASLTIEISSQNAGAGTRTGRAGTGTATGTGTGTGTGTNTGMAGGTGSYQVKLYRSGSGGTIWRYGR